MSYFANGTFVRWSQFNGIVCHGEVLAYASWDAPEDVVLIRYIWNPDGDIPKQAYTLVEANRLIQESEPIGFVKSKWLR